MASPSNGSGAEDRARQIVNYVLDYVAKAGRIEGRRPHKIVTLPLLVNMATGETTGTVYDDMIATVGKIIDGSATYRPQTRSGVESSR